MFKPENIMKLKQCMHNGFSFYQTTYCKTTFLALLTAPILFNRPVVGKTTLLRPKSQQTPRAHAGGG